MTACPVKSIICPLLASALTCRPGGLYGGTDIWSTQCGVESMVDLLTSDTEVDDLERLGLLASALSGSPLQVASHGVWRTRVDRRQHGLHRPWRRHTEPTSGAHCSGLAARGGQPGAGGRRQARRDAPRWPGVISPSRVIERWRRTISCCRRRCAQLIDCDIAARSDSSAASLAAAQSEHGDRRSACSSSVPFGRETCWPSRSRVDSVDGDRFNTARAGSRMAKLAELDDDEAAMALTWPTSSPARSAVAARSASCCRRCWA